MVGKVNNILSTFVMTLNIFKSRGKLYIEYYKNFGKYVYVKTAKMDAKMLDMLDFGSSR